MLLLLNTTGNICVSTCSKGEFVDLVNKKCVICDDGCAECNGSGLDKCTKCTVDSNGDTYYKHPLLN